MKTILLTLAAFLFATSAIAGPTIIGSKDNVPVTIMNAQGVLECYTTHDTKKDVIRINAPGVTFLVAPILRQEFEGANGSVCSQIDKIIEQSFMNFTAFQIVVTSELLLGRQSIMENANLKISNLDNFQGSPKFPVVEMNVQLSQKLKQTEPDFLGN